MGLAMNTWHEVAAPPVVPNRYGLFSVAQMRTGALENGRTDEHWRLGVEWVSQACGYIHTDSLGPCPTSPPGVLTPGDENGYYSTCGPRQFEPFTVYAYNVDPIPGLTLEQERQHAIERLVASEERQAEFGLLQQMQANIGFSVDLSSLNAWYALGMIENNYGWEYGGQFVLHMDRATAISLSLHLHAEGGILRTITGTPVIVGSGYGQFPPGGTYTKHKVYATGPVVVYRSEIDTQADAVSISNNRASVVAQRDYVVAWDCWATEFEIALNQPIP